MIIKVFSKRQRNSFNKIDLLKNGIFKGIKFRFLREPNNTNLTTKTSLL